MSLEFEVTDEDMLRVSQHKQFCLDNSTHEKHDMKSENSPNPDIKKKSDWTKKG